MDVIGTCVSMSLQYGVPLITLVDKFRHARFEPAGMTANKNIPFAKSLIDYIFCWMGCQFIAGYAEKNLPNRKPIAKPKEKVTATAKQLVEKTKDLAKKIAEAKAMEKKNNTTYFPLNSEREKSGFMEPSAKTAAAVKSGACLPTSTLISQSPFEND